MVKGALYVFLHPYRDDCGIRMQLCDGDCVDEGTQYLSIIHGWPHDKMKDGHKGL